VTVIAPSGWRRPHRPTGRDQGSEQSSGSSGYFATSSTSGYAQHTLDGAGSLGESVLAVAVLAGVILALFALGTVVDCIF
jgi:hypothetical protein